jgi:hypothetical protein
MPILGPKTGFLFLSDSCGFVDVGRPVWREDGSVICRGQICHLFAAILSIFVMVAILSSSVSAPLRSVMICWSTFATTLKVSFSDKLCTWGVWADWLGTCCSMCLKGGGAGLRNRGRMRLLLLLRSAAAKDSPGVVWLEENALPDVVLGALLNFLFRILSLAYLRPR